MNGNISMLVITAWRSGSMQSKYNLHDTGKKNIYRWKQKGIHLQTTHETEACVKTLN